MSDVKENRYLSSLIHDDLKAKMIFIGGPRQVGKTTLAKSIADPEKDALYLNWDNTDHRKSILRTQFPPKPLSSSLTSFISTPDGNRT